MESEAQVPFRAIVIEQKYVPKYFAVTCDMSSWAEECVSQSVVNMQGMFKCCPHRLLAGRKLTLKRTGSVSPEHFHKMNLALGEEETTAAGMSI